MPNCPKHHCGYRSFAKSRLAHPFIAFKYVRFFRGTHEIPRPNPVNSRETACFSRAQLAEVGDSNRLTGC